jgi:hypothetical protein
MSQAAVEGGACEWVVPRLVARDNRVAYGVQRPDRGRPREELQWETT